VPTYTRLPSFDRDDAALDNDQREAFRVAVRKFVADLESGGRFRKGLRVQGIRGSSGVYELTWGNNGRATFEYGPSLVPGEPHVIWRRVGTHAIFDEP
jgi:hypothetical protein